MTWCRHPQADSSSLVNLMRGLPFLADDGPVGPPGQDENECSGRPVTSFYSGAASRLLTGRGDCRTGIRDCCPEHMTKRLFHADPAVGPVAVDRGAG
jgi:hypothetical protein